MLASVLINNYNYGKFLGYCIDSVMEQMREDVEIIVYDDGSTDNSKNVLRQYSNQVKLIQRENAGKKPIFNQANAINEAFNNAAGKFIFLLDSDDAFLSQKIQRVIDCFHTDSNIVLVQHPFEEIDENGNKTGTIRPYLKKVEDPFSYIYRTHNLLGIFAQTSALAFRRTYLERILPLREDEYDAIWSDVRLTRQSIFYGEICTIREVLGQYRVHDTNDTRRLEDRQYMDEVLTQMYAFFNERACEKGFEQIDRSKSVNRQGLKGVQKLFHYIWSREPIEEKLAYTRNRIAALVEKRQM